MKKENLWNQKFGRLLVIAEAEPINKRVAWLCRCDCGVEKIIKAEHLRDGTTKSCGCLNDEKRKERAHGLYAPCIKYHPSETTARRVWKKRYDNGISFEDFMHISQMNCHYCGAAPNNKQNAASEDKKSSQYAKDNGDFIYNGLDRIDSNLPHTMDNCVPCCWICNRAKCAMTSEDFDIWIEQVYQTLQKRKSH
jgi:hypothetical protein